MSSRFFDSRTSEHSAGVGFPSCNTELSRIPLNRKDPHGYYRELGVYPWSTESEIRSAARSLYRRFHPDTGTHPDPYRLQRVKLICEVLLDPEQRRRYNRTPAGKRLLDPVYLSELSAITLSDSDIADLSEELAPEKKPPRPLHYDYFLVDQVPGDFRLAQDWYESFLCAARLLAYRRTIRVLIHDGPAFFHPETSVVSVHRSWTPSPLLAFGVLVVEAGMQNPAWNVAQNYGRGVV